MNINVLKYIFSVAIFLLLSTNTYSTGLQEMRPELVAIVDSMSKEECVNLYRPKFFDKFKQTVLLDELKTLIHHQNFVVRAYSFWALSFIDKDQSFDILIQNICNNKNYGCYYEPIHNFLGLEMYETYYISEGYLLYRIWNDHSRNRDRSENQRKLIDSLILHKKTVIPIYEAFENFQPDMAHYERIKELATDTTNVISSNAIRELAKYHCKEDIPLIMQFFNNKETNTYALIAIAEFPDSAFYGIIKSSLSEELKGRHFYHGRIRLLCMALVQYPTIETVEFLKRTRKKTMFHKRNFYDEALLNAIEKHPNDIFIPLKRGR